MYNVSTYKMVDINTELEVEVDFNEDDFLEYMNENELSGEKLLEYAIENDLLTFEDINRYIANLEQQRREEEARIAHAKFQEELKKKQTEAEAEKKDQLNVDLSDPDSVNNLIKKLLGMLAC